MDIKTAAILEKFILRLLAHHFNFKFCEHHERSKIDKQNMSALNLLCNVAWTDELKNSFGKLFLQEFSKNIGTTEELDGIVTLFRFGFICAFDFEAF